ncbi:DUF4112 domain-containing protein [Halopelagius longus]|uniref:DUF4112 domain-containing protein n=1 Tax=Halopelagius longus TaxID=1236180 RepID=A0A1H1E578_9EURY|nr:DUF4112 domain-containing protein [Halopelagius longus]RDI71613.1 DUF4112 domain-containing protein [Halopelagius longus]SDQ83925.1 protein of unknown function [Halopelagius longus]
MDDSSTRDFRSEFDIDFEGELPPTVDESAIRRMRTVARLFDDSIPVPGTDFRIGIDPVLGALPVAGDVVSAGFSLYIVLESARLGVSFTTLLKMLATITIDAVGGSVPILGSIFDSVWKANQWNLKMALEDLAEPPGGEGDEDADAIEIEID